MALVVKIVITAWLTLRALKSLLLTFSLSAMSLVRKGKDAASDAEDRKEIGSFAVKTIGTIIWSSMLIASIWIWL